MTKKFFAEMLVSSKHDRATSRLELCLTDAHGNRQALSLSPEALAGLAAALQALPVSAASHTGLTKMPDSFSVGRGRHESVVLVRFEDDTPYGLSAAQAAELGEALLEEAETTADAQYDLRH
ncbi:hypothetical protein DLM45_03490 [Hyphomicrobium methylovorum]|uniref:hypothetical protein n=1 Tax=Hyphomicrobium methylovorum TaxID=84 RepID=UPI0015E63FFA|nr:hypothetical protein [Hyphomicrobium methylovorum]MBA2125286.1 hypothetical protein [Hyphomicrobium methylovorum]